MLSFVVFGPSLVTFASLGGFFEVDKFFTMSKSGVNSKLPVWKSLHFENVT